MGGLCAVALAGTVPACGGSTGASATGAIDLGLGRLHVRLAPARAASAAYDPSTASATVLTVTDGGGTTWRLSLPPGATTAPVTVTMIPFASVSGPSRLDVTSGVQFSPDGLELLRPATLSVSPAGAPDARRQIYVASRRGTGLAFGAMTAADRADIFHFSDAADGAVLDPRMVAAAQGLSLVVSQGLEHVGDVPLPEPPSIPLQCIALPAGAGNPVALSYAEDAYRVEDVDAAIVLGVFMSEVTWGFTATGPLVYRNLAGMYARAEAQLTDAIEAHQDDADAFVALSTAAQVLQGQEQATLGTLALFGGGPLPPAHTAVDAEVAQWALGLAGRAVDTLATGHDLRSLPEILYLAQSAASFGADTGPLQARLDDALHFTLGITESVDETGNGVEIVSEQIQGDAALSPQIQPEATGLVLTGSVPMAYQSYSSDFLTPFIDGLYAAGTAVGTQTGVPSGSQESATATPFTAKVTATLADICAAPTLTVQQDPYGGTVTVTSVLGTASAPDASVGPAVPTWSGDGADDTVTLPAVVGQATVADHTFDYAPVTGIDMKLGYVLTHQG